VEYSGFMRGIVTHMKDDGFIHVRHRYQISERGYRSPRNFLERIWLRLRMYTISPTFFALRMLFDRRPAIVVASTNPFYFPTIACLLGSRRHRIIHLVYDIYPEAFLQAGTMREGSSGFKIVDASTRYAFTHADANVFLSPSAMEDVKVRIPDVRRPLVIPIGADEIALGDPLSHKGGSECVQVMYCGNMGRMHDADTLAGALHKLDAKGGIKGIRVEVRASGCGYANLCEALDDLNNRDGITLGDYLPSREWRDAMLRTDVALITMRLGAEKVVTPSKLYSAMQAGQAVIAVAAADSDLAKTVREGDCGWVIEPGDSTALAELLAKLPELREEIRRKQARSLELASGRFSCRVAATKWEALARELMAASE
jgi:glycosyltransferase involved in cell wall biosynthesis